MMTRVMSRESYHRKEGAIARAYIYYNMGKILYNMGKILAGGNVVVASTIGEIGRSIGAGDKRTSPS